MNSYNKLKNYDTASPPKVTVDSRYDYEGDGKFNKGDVVIFSKLESPNMIVLDIIFEEGKTSKDVYSKSGGKILLGILCGWFTKTNEWKQQLFNSKDLEILEYI